jgi:pimeloyl-ACP methyl ester carboxylesterase
MIAAAPELVEKTFAAGPVSIAYAEGPENGPPLVLIHGVGRNWRDFLPIIPELARTHHVYAVDLRGHGGSTRVPGRYTSADYAADIAQFLSKVVQSRAVLFGHSLGGIIAIRLAANSAGTVSAIIVGDSVLSHEVLQSSLYTALFAGLLRVIRQGGSVSHMATEIGRIEIPVPDLDYRVALADLPGNDVGYLHRWADCLRRVDPEVFAMTLDGSTLADFDAPAFLRRISCPMLILQASPDLGGLMSDDDIDRVLRVVSTCSVERFPLLGHALHLQRPKPVLDAVLRFLSSLT